MLELFVHSTREVTIISILKMGKGRLSEVKSTVQQGYTAGLGTGRDMATSEPSGVIPELRVLVWHRLLAARFLMAQPDASIRSKAGCSKAGTGLWKAFFGGLLFNRPACSDPTPRDTVGAPCYRAQGPGPYVQTHMLHNGKSMSAQSWGFLTWSQTNFPRLICQLP